MTHYDAQKELKEIANYFERSQSEQEAQSSKNKDKPARYCLARAIYCKVYVEGGVGCGEACFKVPEKVKIEPIGRTFTEKQYDKGRN